MWWLVVCARAADAGARSVPVDVDGDGVDDAVDSCPSVANPTQTAVFADAVALPSPGRTQLAALAAGDLDGDGDTDLIGVEYGGLLGDTLATWLRSPTGWTSALGPAGYAHEISLADLDGDGDLDALIPFEARWYRNDGAGAFTLAQTFHPAFDDYEPSSEGTTPLDADGDGDVDVAYVVLQWDFYGGTGYASYLVGLLVNDGAGTLTDAGTFDSAADVGRLVSGDVDGDGDVDLVRLETYLHDLYVYPNDGTGGFALQASQVADVQAVAAGDLDGDGDADLVAAKVTGDVVVLESTPAGLVEHALNLPPADPARVAMSDLDRDGDLDLVATGADTVWWQNTGGLTFADGAVAAAGGGDALAIGDADGSGTTDIVVGLDASDAPLHVPNVAPADHDAVPPCDADDSCPLDPAPVCVDTDGDGLSDADETAVGTLPTSPDTDGDGANDLAEVLGATDPLSPDTDGDGVDDGVDPCPHDPEPDHDGICGCGPPRGPEDDLDGDGVVDWCDDCPGLADPSQGPGWAAPIEVADSDWFALADLDGDVDLDLVVASPTTGLGIVENLGGGVFGAAGFVGDGGLSVAAADVDEDGLPDVVLTEAGSSDVVWRRNLGGLTLGAAVAIGTHTTSPYVALVVEDLVGGPAPDVALLDAFNWTTIENLGGGAFAAPVVTPSPDVTSFPRLVSADTDGDGDRDLVIDTVQLYIAENAGGTFGTPALLPGTAYAGEVSAGDLDGDGDTDLAFATGPWDRELQWLENDGGTWSVHDIGSIGIGSFPRIVVVDLDGDRAQDLVVVASNALLEWFEGDGAGGFAEPRAINAGATSWWQLAVADVDLDARPDLVVSGWYAVDWLQNDGTPDADGDGVCDPLDADFVADVDGDGLDAAGEAQAGTDPSDADTDDDGVLDGADACPRVADPAQTDVDGDGLADACDPCPRDAGDETDADGDGVCDADDVCPGYPDDADDDSDGVPNPCDGCPDDPTNDSDGDGVCDLDDACLGYPDDVDTDRDGAPDGCDPCPDHADDDACDATSPPTETDGTPAAHPPAEATADGCGCRSVGGSGGGWLAGWALGGLGMLARRRR